MVTKNKKTSSLDLSQSRISCMLADRSLRSEIASLAHTGGWSTMPELNASTPAVAEHLDLKPDPAADVQFFSTRGLSEAIVLAIGRPVLFIADGLVERAASKSIEAMIAPHRTRLAKPISSVGRLELMDHDSLEWVGTGWRIEEDIIVTNRHVAMEFALRQGNRFTFRTNQVGKDVRARIDFREEYRVHDSSEFNIAEILWIAPDVDTAPDVAILRINQDANLPPPLVLAKSAIQPGESIAVVGYPARDSRNDSELMARIFGNVYDVKRFSPGNVVAMPKDEWYLSHDCSTLGGSSGSCVLQMATGEVVGLHFGGHFRKVNYAVHAKMLRQLLTRRSWVPVTAQEIDIAQEKFRETKRTANDLKDRSGFDDRFSGIVATIPTPGRSHKVLKAGVKNRLNYQHFSIVMSESRRFPIVTAVNIDGQKKRMLKRVDRWGFDPRIPNAMQVGHDEFYGPEAFDKGHLVRREDPGWGDTEEEARLGEDDTFMFTNAVPQVPQLNQRNWLALEDYVLGHARTKGFSVSVFTGPVFRSNDPRYAVDKIAVPLDFFKVVVALDADDGQLLLSAYMLSQESMMPQEGFRYGPFRTYQVPLSKIEQDADLRFSAAMRKADVFAGKIQESLLATHRYPVIEGPRDIVLQRGSELPV